MDLAENHYLNLLSRGGLIVPSAKLAEYTSHCFAIMDYSYNIVHAHGVMDVRAAYTQIFDRFPPQIEICCSKHNYWGLKFAAKIVINTLFNNKQTVSSDSARKDTCRVQETLKNQIIGFLLLPFYAFVILNW